MFEEEKIQSNQFKNMKKRDNELSKS
jgi:hypothetical protein